MPTRLFDLFGKCSSVENLISWLFQLGLLLSLGGCACKSCQEGRFGLRKDESFSRDGYCWRCSNKRCNKKVSIRKGSWFSKSNLTLEQIVFLTYFWVRKADQEFVEHELQISSPTIVDWYNFSREVCIEILEKDSKQIGGPGCTVEIDESKFGKRKYHKGRKVDGVWVFGGIERDTKNCFFTCVADRTAETLTEIIKNNIKPGTTIISDCWKAYSKLDQEGFKHLTVNHSVNFVDPETGAHTNTIESTWRALKKSLPKHGTTKVLYDSYFAQYCVRKKYLTGLDPFLQFLELIGKIYNVNEVKDTLVCDKVKEKTPKEKPQIPAKRRILQDLSNLNDSLDDFQC